ncbi:MAG: hypothetical protein U5O39_08505 [Gammaproteobacteria bacterium]|nr:hypothetical protein [Gammaproteobacteria bacterium]
MLLRLLQITPCPLEFGDFRLSPRLLGFQDLEVGRVGKELGASAPTSSAFSRIAEISAM